MKSIIKHLILFVLLTCGSFAWSQVLQPPLLSTLPPSIKWQQINSEHFKIIFPDGFQKEANRVTNILERIYVPGSHSLGVQPRRFPVLLQNNISSSNGIVTIGPYRSEFHTLSPQLYTSVGNDLWMEHLASHEYRHMVQFEKSLSKFNKFMYYLFGEYGAGFSAGIAAPSWFFEGDAVGTETAMGRSGRGRTPSFLMAFKANTIEKGGFNYYKQHLKSFRDFVPNHYVTGYLMTTDLKNEYGPDIWDKITHDSFRHPYIPFTFSNSIKKHTGKHLVPAYKNMMSRQKELYAEQIAKINPTPFETINTEKKTRYTNYSFPHQMGNGDILTIKVGMGDIYQLATIDQTGGEKTISLLGTYENNGYLSANDSVVVWIENEFDPRWYKRTYSVIKKLNINKGKIRRVTAKSRYTAAAISKDSKTIIATHQTENSIHTLQLLDAHTGDVIKIYENPDNAFYSMPSFDENNDKILVLKHHLDGKQIVLKSIETGQESEVVFLNNEIIGHPVQHGDYIYYNTNFNGVDNIFCVDNDSKEIFQITNSKYGAFNPSFSQDGNALIYNEYTVNGMNVVRSALDARKWIPKESVEYIGFDFQKTMVENENIQDHLYGESEKEYESKKYQKLGRSFRPVSWGVGIDPLTNDYIIGMLSRDILSTTSMDALVRYNSNERSWKYSANISYQALYPIIDAGGSIANRTVRLLSQGDTLRAYGWKENAFKLGIRLPFLLSNSKYSRSFTFGSSTNIGTVENFNVPPFEPSTVSGNLYSLSTYFTFSRLLKRSQLEINPRFGQSLLVNLKQTPFGGDYKGTLLAAQGNLYFPGLFKHQSLHFRGSYQVQNMDNYYFTSPIIFTRGYLYTPFEKYSNLSANYKLPLAYMDFHVGPIINIQRIYTNVFYDYGMGSTQDLSDRTLKSYGAELSFNFNLMRYLLLFDVGVRYSYRPDSSKGMIEIIIGSVSM